VQAVLDANVLVSALLSSSGTPATLMERWLLGEFELVVSERLLDEVERTLARPKIRARIPADTALEFISVLRSLADIRVDPAATPTVRSRDPADDYLIALAAAERATLVSGDAHLLDLRTEIPVVSPREFLDSL
jgi:putative PIN family toxin of toxin-antitoxin system